MYRDLGDVCDYLKEILEDVWWCVYGDCGYVYEDMGRHEKICGAGIGRLSQTGAVVNLFSPQNGLIYPLEDLLFIQASYLYQGNLIQYSTTVAIKGPYLIHIHIYIHYKTITTYVTGHVVHHRFTLSIMSPWPSHDHPTYNKTIPVTTGTPHPSQGLPVHHQTISPSVYYGTISPPQDYLFIIVTFHILCFQITLFSKAKSNIQQRSLKLNIFEITQKVFSWVSRFQRTTTTTKRF